MKIMIKTAQAKRFMDGKNRLDLVPPILIEEVGKILTFGAEKYGANNYKLGMDWSKCIASLKRHLTAFEKGIDRDEESNELHISHCIVNAMFLLEYYKLAPQYDDRLHGYLKPKRIGLDLDQVCVEWVEPWCKLHKIPIAQSWHFQWNTQELFAEMKKRDELDKFYMNLKPKINPQELKFEPTCYITHRPVSKEVTEEWLEKNGFPLKPVFQVKKREDKLEVAKEMNLDIFVDDSADTFIYMNQNGICTYLMDAPHNQHIDVGYKRIKSLNELI